MKLRSFTKVSILAIGLIVVEKPLIGQSNQYIPKIIPPSPNAAALMKFTDVPVSTYTGTADITVPIYEIQLRGMTIPIGISYHTGGIRLREEASWVGLGWALNAGGMISRVINDKDDFGGEYMNAGVPEINTDVFQQTLYSGPGFTSMGKLGYDFFCNYEVNTYGGVLDFSSVMGTSNVVKDLESDVFSYNFPGHSNKFVISRSGIVIQQKQDNNKISFASDGSSFKILDDQGNQYYFNALEVTHSSAGGADQVSSWKLTKVVTQLNDSVIFHYATDNTWTYVVGDKVETYRTACAGNEGLTTYQSPDNYYWNMTLDWVEFQNGKVEFSYDANRDDLNGGKKLNAIKVYAKDKFGQYSVIKASNFYYSYFNSTYGTPEFMRLKLDSVKEVSGSNSLPPYKFEYFLPDAQIQHSGKHSYSIDHWGYFNGIGNTTLVPKFNGIFAPPGLYPYGSPVYLSLSGANRTPNFTYMKVFAMNKVTYPTGGYTTLDYEPNDYDQSNSTNGSSDFQDIPLIDTFVQLHFSSRELTEGSIDLSKIFGIAQNLGSNATLSVTFRSNNNDGNAAYRNTSGKIYFNFAGQSIDISSSIVTCPSGTPICTTGSIPLTFTLAKSYDWQAYIDPTVGSDFNEIQVTVTWKELQTLHYNNTTLMASGLRIKAIADYSSDGYLAKSRKFLYNYYEDKQNAGYEQKYSYGRLMSYVAYARFEPIIINVNGSSITCESLTRMGNSNTSVTSEISGNIVGYDQVTEFTYDPVSGTDNGKTVSYYFNSPDTTFSFNGFRLPGALNMGNNLNGSLLRQVVYGRNGSQYFPISEIQNAFSAKNRGVLYSMKSAYARSTSGTSSICPNNVCVPYEYLASFYPSMKSERVLLDSTIKISYDQFDPLKQMISTVRYYYDNIKHYEVTRTRTMDSKGQTVVSFAKYPEDFLIGSNTETGNEILDSMIHRNIVDQVIESRDSLQKPFDPWGISGASKSWFKIGIGGSVLAEAKDQLAINSLIDDYEPLAINGNSVTADARFREMIRFSHYDQNNNIDQYIATDLIPVSFIWDYQGRYPTAKVINADFNEIAYSSFEAENSSWIISGGSIINSYAFTGNWCMELGSGIISKSELPAGDYIISYWSRNGSLNISGSTSQSGPTRNGWTYYEHKVSNVTSISISGSKTIDELRLFPVDAQMTTYTYQPLVGVTSECDQTNRVNYYEYDEFNRLKILRDQDGNIIRKMDYQYQQNMQQ